MKAADLSDPGMIESHRFDLNARFGDQQIELPSAVGSVARLDDDAHFDERDRTHQPDRISLDGDS